MAQLQVQTDMLVPGSWTVRSDHPGALAGVSDAIVQSLGLSGEALGAWALHYDEQDMHAEDAYARERHELGMHANVQVVALPTPARAHTVYVDRLHLLAVAAPPDAGSRLAGLYVGTAGDLVLSVHHPSVTMNVGGVLSQLPHDRSLQDGQRLVGDSRFVLHFHRDDPTAVQVRAPQPMALPVQDALGRLAGLVAGW
ncbi:MAG: hypothetical protein JWO69_944 [Thermoleophilia bacterium]|jgi:hypothetical protein|nr:hypothetical protein [Thermoleophilia bacterium]